MPGVPELRAVTAVDVIGDQALRLTFDDGLVGEVAFGDREWPGVLAPLTDPAFFAQAFVDLGTVCWPGDLDLAPEPLYEEASRNRVTPASSRH